MNYQQYETQNQQTACSNTLSIVLTLLLMVSLGSMGYIYYANDIVQKGELKEKYILKEDIDFYMLPTNIQEQYISKYKYESDVASAKSSVATPCEPKVIEKIVEVEKIVQVPTQTTIADTNIDRAKFEVYQCYDFTQNNTHISKECEKQLIDFVHLNNDAKLFEVIPTMTPIKIEQTLMGIEQEKLEKYLNTGLALSRAQEAIWPIKNTIADKVNVQIANYVVDFEKNGVIVRAYK
ncbi:MAG: hypothetical protein IE909_03935 [Campylobacterales bacterium]|nr:hypothetical protein [Campylobacterales bacterium]